MYHLSFSSLVFPFPNLNKHQDSVCLRALNIPNPLTRESAGLLEGKDVLEVSDIGELGPIMFMSLSLFFLWLQEDDES